MRQTAALRRRARGSRSPERGVRRCVANLRALVEDHWAVLKAGPALTFAMREALFALAAIENELVAEGERSELLSVVELRMQEKPGY